MIYSKIPSALSSELITVFNKRNFINILLHLVTPDITVKQWNSVEWNLTVKLQYKQYLALFD